MRRAFNTAIIISNYRLAGETYLKAPSSHGQSVCQHGQMFPNHMGGKSRREERQEVLLPPANPTRKEHIAANSVKQGKRQRAPTAAEAADGREANERKQQRAAERATQASIAQKRLGAKAAETEQARIERAKADIDAMVTIQRNQPR